MSCYTGKENNSKKRFKSILVCLKGSGQEQKYIYVLYPSKSYSPIPIPKLYQMYCFNFQIKVHEELCLVHEAYQFFRGRFISKVNQLSQNIIKPLKILFLLKNRDKAKWVHVEGLLEQESKIGLANKVGIIKRVIYIFLYS